MYKQNSLKLNHLSLLVVITSSIFLLSGCTFFNKTDPDYVGEEKSNPVPIEEFSVSLHIIDQNGEEISSSIPLEKEENVYELLNKAVINSDTLTMEFEFFEMNGQEEVSVNSINGYNPSEDNKAWTFKINDALSPTGLLETFPEDEDIISFELEELPD